MRCTHLLFLRFHIARNRKRTSISLAMRCICGEGGKEDRNNAANSIIIMHNCKVHTIVFFVRYFFFLVTACFSWCIFLTDAVLCAIRSPYCFTFCNLEWLSLHGYSISRHSILSHHSFRQSGLERESFCVLENNVYYHVWFLVCSVD